jgi:hypothetical protein
MKSQKTQKTSIGNGQMPIDQNRPGETKIQYIYNILAIVFGSIIVTTLYYLFCYFYNIYTTYPVIKLITYLLTFPIIIGIHTTMFFKIFEYLYIHNHAILRRFLIIINLLLVSIMEEKFKRLLDFPYGSVLCSFIIFSEIYRYYSVNYQYNKNKLLLLFFCLSRLIHIYFTMLPFHVAVVLHSAVNAALLYSVTTKEFKFTAAYLYYPILLIIPFIMLYPIEFGLKFYRLSYAYGYNVVPLYYPLLDKYLRIREARSKVLLELKNVATKNSFTSSFYKCYDYVPLTVREFISKPKNMALLLCFLTLTVYLIKNRSISKAKQENVTKHIITSTTVLELNTLVFHGPLMDFLGPVYSQIDNFLDIVESPLFDVAVHFMYILHLMNSSFVSVDDLNYMDTLTVTKKSDRLSKTNTSNLILGARFIKLLDGALEDIMLAYRYNDFSYLMSTPKKLEYFLNEVHQVNMLYSTIPTAAYLKHRDGLLQLRALRNRILRLVDSGKTISVEFKSLSYISKSFRDAQVKLNEIYGKLENILALQGSKPTPIGVGIVGDPKTGKSFVAKFVMRILANISGHKDDKLDDLIYNKSLSDAFWSGMKPFYPFCYIDDLGNSVDPLDTIYNILLTVISPMKAVLNMAELSDKGSMLGNFIAVVFTTNLQDGGVKGKLRQPEAFKRRFISISTFVKKEYRENGIIKNDNNYIANKTFYIDNDTRKGRVPVKDMIYISIGLYSKNTNNHDNYIKNDIEGSEFCNTIFFSIQESERILEREFTKEMFKEEQYAQEISDLDNYCEICSSVVCSGQHNYVFDEDHILAKEDERSQSDSVYNDGFDEEFEIKDSRLNAIILPNSINIDIDEEISDAIESESDDDDDDSFESSDDEDADELIRQHVFSRLSKMKDILGEELAYTVFDAVANCDAKYLPTIETVVSDNNFVLSEDDQASIINKRFVDFYRSTHYQPVHYYCPIFDYLINYQTYNSFMNILICINDVDKINMVFDDLNDYTDIPITQFLVILCCHLYGDIAEQAVQEQDVICYFAAQYHGQHVHNPCISSPLVNNGGENIFDLLITLTKNNAGNIKLIAKFAIVLTTVFGAYKYYTTSDKLEKKDAIEDIEVVLGDLDTDLPINSNRPIKKDIWKQDISVRTDIFSPHTKSCQIQDLIKLVSKNLFALVFPQIDATCNKYYILGVKDTMYIGYRHIFNKFIDEANKLTKFSIEVIFNDINLNSSVNRTRTITLTNDMIQLSDDEPDLVCINIPGFPNTNIIKHFPPSYVYKSYASSLLLPHFDVFSDKYGIGVFKGVTSEYVSDGSPKEKELLLAKSSLKFQPIDCDYTFKKGDCGAIIVGTMNTNNSGAFIFGMKTVGNPFTNTVFATRLTQKNINNMIVKQMAYHADIFKIPMEVMEYEYNDCVIYSPTDFNISNLNPSSTLRRLRGCGMILGSIDGYGPIKQESQVKPQFNQQKVLKAGLVEYVERYPPILKRGYVQPENKWVDPFYTNINDIITVQHNINSSILKDCAVNYLERIDQNVPIYPILKPLSLHEAINGNDEPFINSLDMQTSSGFGLSGPKSDHFDLYEDDINHNMQYKMKKNTLKQFNDFHQTIRDPKHRIFVPILNACLKDEPVKEHKRECTRLFTCLPMYFTIALRMYLLPIINFMQNNPYIFELAVGMNCFNTEHWGAMYNYMTNIQGYNYSNKEANAAGDFHHFDKRICEFMIYYVHLIIITLCVKCGYKTNDLLVIKFLLKGLSNPLINVNGDLIWLLNFNPSGWALTVILNSVSNSNYMRYAFIKCRYKITLFNILVHLMTYGDDNMLLIHIYYIQRFNHTTIAKHLMTIGIVYTMPDKSSESKPFVNINSIDFLKRKFIKDELRGGVYRAPLDETSLSKMMLYRTEKKNKDVYDTYISTMNSFLLETYVYGDSIFHDKRAILQAVINSSELLLQERVRCRPLISLEEARNIIDG